MKFTPCWIAAVALLAVGCSNYAEVGEKRPRRLPPPSAEGTLLPVEQSIHRAIDQSDARPLGSLETYVTALAAASRELEAAPGNPTARRDYNFALCRIFTTLRDARLDPWSQPLQAGDYTITTPPVPSARPEWNPARYEFIPADQLDIKGSYMTQRMTKDGLGASLVARRRESRKDAREAFVSDRPYYGVTAIAKVEGRRCVISFMDPLAVENVQLGSHRYPLAADYSAPLAVMLAENNPKKLEIARLLNPGKHAEAARISRLQPYDPNKTVVLCVHGLMDSPATWAPLLNALRADPTIRSRYQFWFYSYPSGYPYPYSAAILRSELDAVEKKFPLHRPMVLIGHSMGGIISRLMITDSGDQLWLAMFGKTPGQTQVSAHARATLNDALVFRHRPEVGRVIFIASPHRGSDLAKNWLGRIGSKLVKPPSTLLQIGSEMHNVITRDAGDLQLSRLPNSVDTLAPNNRFVKAINRIPITPGIPYHTIVGDRGRGDTPASSDGIVPYWSSHLEGARSELVVPSNHSAHQNPQAIAEVRRILKLHASP